MADDELKPPPSPVAPESLPMQLGGLSRDNIESMRYGLASSGPLAQAVLNNNAAGLIAALPFGAMSQVTRCTSTTRPSDPVEGQLIYEIDTDILLAWNGSAWKMPRWTNPVEQSPRFADVNASVTVAETAGNGTATLNLIDNAFPVASEGTQLQYDSATGNSFLRSTFPTGSLYLGAGSGTAAQTQFAPDGRIIGNHIWVGSYRAAFPSGISQAATVNITVPFRSNITFFGSASAYASSGGTRLYRFYMAINTLTGWNEAQVYYHNNTFDHRTYPTGIWNFTLNAGTYAFLGGMVDGQQTDNNDQLSLLAVGKAIA